MTTTKTGAPEIAYRTVDLELEIGTVDDATRAANPEAKPPVTIALSSEHAVERYDFWNDERYLEVLDHSPTSVDLSYARDGLPLLLDHTAREHVGIINNVRLGADKKLRGDVTFSRSQKGQEVEQDVRDGIRKKVSVGYRIDRDHLQVTRGKDDAIETRRSMRWTPMEGSMVAIPADYGVGVGRSDSTTTTSGDGDAAVRAAVAVLRHSRPDLLTPAPKAKERTVDATENAAPDTGATRTTGTITVAERDEAVKAERARTNEIRKLALSHGIADERVEQWITEGRSKEAVATEILSTLQERGDSRVVTGKPAVEMTDKERKQYSFARAILLHANELEGRKSDASFEQDVHQELERHVPAGVKRRGGVLVPTFTSAESAREVMAAQNGWSEYGVRAGLDSATSTKGQELKFTVPGDFINLLRNRMVMMDAGITLMAGLQGPVAFPSQTGAATATWVGENPGSDVADSNLTLSQVALNPKSIQASTSYSRQLLAQAVIDVDALVRTDLAQVNALALDAAIINGAGGNAPTGILGTSGIGSVALGTNGATPTYNNLVDLETQVTAANADQWPLSYIVHPTSRGTFKKATALGNTVGAPVWTKNDDAAMGARVAGGSARVPGELNGYTAWASGQVPNNLTKGTSSGICLAILFGAFSQCVLGDWGMMELIVDPYRLKKQGMIEVTSFAMYGFAVKYAAALAAIKDALA